MTLKIIKAPKKEHLGPIGVRHSHKSLWFATALALTFLVIRSVGAEEPMGSVEDPDPLFDRLDGTGKSGKKVDVVEWEGNLEIHVYPKGSVKGLGMKIVREKGKKVMVISYRLDTTPKPLIRRAILSIPITDGFYVYKDLTADTYDKFIATNNTLKVTQSLALFKLDPTPEKEHPDDPLPNKGKKLAGHAGHAGYDGEAGGENGEEDLETVDPLNPLQVTPLQASPTQTNPKRAPAQEPAQSSPAQSSKIQHFNF